MGISILRSVVAGRDELHSCYLADVHKYGHRIDTCPSILIPVEANESQLKSGAFYVAFMRQSIVAHISPHATELYGTISAEKAAQRRDHVFRICISIRMGRPTGYGNRKTCRTLEIKKRNIFINAAPNYQKSLSLASLSRATLAL
jgi:hypothetical protein